MITEVSIHNNVTIIIPKKDKFVILTVGKIILGDVYIILTFLRTVYLFDCFRMLIKVRFSLGYNGIQLTLINNLKAHSKKS